MSLFGGPAAQAQISVATSGRFRLPTFGASSAGGTTTATTSASTGFTFGVATTTTGIGIPVAPISTTANLAGSTVAQTNVGVGLGGIAPSAPNALQITQDRHVKPKDIAVPSEVMELVENLRKQIRLNKDASDEIGLADMYHLKSLENQIDIENRFLTSVSRTIEKHEAEVKLLGQENRQELRQSELAQRRHSSLPNLTYQPLYQSMLSSADDITGFEQNGTIEYLHHLASNYECQLEKFDLELSRLGNFVLNRGRLKNEGALEQKTSKDDMAASVKKFDSDLKNSAIRTQNLHECFELTKKDFLFEYQRSGTGAGAKLSDLLSKELEPSPRGKQAYNSMTRLHGPSPFETTSNRTVRLGSGLGTIGSGNVGSRFSTPTSGLSFDAESITKPFSGFTAANQSQTLFKPFSSSGFGAQTQQPLGFGSSVSNFTSGTLFGGSATKQPSFSFGK